ncbi:hypothetical protein ONZ45_g1014 [Pleurotus djamor]|nr:hypothetical protein ONZ45_g1014 [Pleurotus djamor]
MRFFIVPALAAASMTAAQMVVQVGSTQTAPGGVFQFIPPTITASNGTVVSFMFTGAPGNHSVTQSSFADPCNPLSGGFDSGWVFIPPSNVSEPPVWNLTITDDSRPIWFYCKQLLPGPHCNAGMVGAINAPSSGNTFQAFQTAAMAHSGNPGQAVGALSGPGANATAVPGPLTDGAQLVGTPAGASGSAAATDYGSSPAYSAPAPTSSGAGTGNGALSTVGLSAISVASIALFVGTLLA